MTNVKSIYGHENNFPTINSCHFIHKTWGGVWTVIAISSCTSKFQESADNQHFLSTSHCNNSVRMHRMILVLGPFLIGIQCPIGLCKLSFN